MVEAAHRYARIAADRARRVYAHGEAEEFFKIARETSASDAERIDLEERLGDVYDTVGMYGKGVACYTRAHDLGPGDAAASLRLRRKSVALERKAALSPAPTLLQQVRSLLAEAADHPRERCELLLEFTNLPNASGTTEAAEEAVRIAGELGDSLLLADALQRVAVVHIFGGGRPTEAFAYLQRAQELVTLVGDPLRSAVYYAIAGIAHAKRGEYLDARREFTGMLEISERLGDPRKIGVACNNLGAVLLRLGEFEEARQLLERARVLHQRRDRSALVQSSFNLAELHRLTGDLSTAIEHYAHLLERAREFEYWSSEAVAQAGLGLSHLEAGRLEEARECAWRAVAVVADREEWFEDRNIVETLLARLEALDGQADVAAQRLVRVAEALHAADVYLWAMVQIERARLVRETDPEGASTILFTVLEGTSRMQSPLLHTQIAVLRETLPQLPAPEQVT
ncbi:MAG: tetratricopeptide repeat protein [Gemmatimonadetes bacterium]|nr:tetratricopeptide repeat protein [Gemmatimonadota bacterium]